LYENWVITNRPIIFKYKRRY